MFYRLLLLFTMVPLAELYLLIKVGKFVGTMNVIALVILTGIVGAYFARQQGAGILSSIRISINQGKIPGNEMLQGIMVLIGGILLITPGFITDLIGFSFLIPLSRRFYTKLAINHFKRKFQSSGIQNDNYHTRNETSGRHIEE